MPALLPGPDQLPVVGGADPDDAIFETIFATGEGEGAVPLLWEQAARCPCIRPDTKQPLANDLQCGGTGIIYQPPVQITGLFRSQSRWSSYRREGELAHGEASLTTALSVKPKYTDRRVRDRITVPPAVDDSSEGRAFYPAGPPTPFIFNGIQRGWRVQLQSAETTQQRT